MAWHLPGLRRKDGEALIWGHHDGMKRHWAYVGDHCISLEFGHVPGSKWVEFRHGGGYVEGIGIAVGLGYGLWLTWKLPWSWTKRVPFWPYGDRTTGWRWSSGTASLQFCHDPMGDHYFNQGWKRWFSPGHREIKVWDVHWITGRDKYQKISETEKHRILVPVGEWPGDEYPYDVHIESVSWTNRFRTKRRRHWEFTAVDGVAYNQRAGKGENSWDLDDDGIYGCSFDIDALDAKSRSGRADMIDLVEAMKQRILADRRRYGRPHSAPDVALSPNT